MKNINNLLSRELLQKTEALNKIEQHLRFHLPKELADHIKVIALKHGELKIMVDSNAWASRIRYLQKEIVKSFLGDPAFHVQTLKIKVGSWQTGFTTAEPKVLSKTAQKQISESVKRISDPDLKAAFQKYIDK